MRVDALAPLGPKNITDEGAFPHDGMAAGSGSRGTLLPGALNPRRRDISAAALLASAPTSGMDRAGSRKVGPDTPMVATTVPSAE
jgi:hypothetical protein